MVCCRLLPEELPHVLHKNTSLYVALQRAKKARDRIVIACLLGFADLNRIRIRRETSTGKQEDSRRFLGG